MSNITTAITEIKSKVSLQECQQRILDCQNSGMSIKAWCQTNGISTGSRMWVYCNGKMNDHSNILFEYQPTRTYSKRRSCGKVPR